MDVALQFNRLVDSQKIAPMKHWGLQLFRCENLYQENEDCTRLNELENKISLPGVQEISEIRSQLSLKPNIALINYEFSDTELTWIANQPMQQATLIFPHMQHLTTQMTLPYQASIQLGSESDVRITFPFRSIQGKQLEIRIQINENASWFGPSLLPPALVSPNSERDFIDLGAKYQFGAHMNRLLEVIVPLLFAAMALVLDHSASAGFLSLFAASRAAKSSLSFFWEISQSSYGQPLIFALHGLQVGLLVIFLFSIGKIYLRNTQKIGLALSMLLLGLSGHFLNIDFVRSDLIWDCILAISGMVYCLLLFFSTGDKKNKQLLVIFLVLLAFLHTNFQQLFGLDQKLFKDFLDWRNQILVPGLVFAAFIEIGSVYNTIQLVSKIVREKTELDKEIEISKKIQRATLPMSKYSGESWRWHAIYRPATNLAGDWYDVREIALGDGKSLFVAAVVDVTGHGIGAALMTSNIASHWSMWVREIPNHLEDLKSFLDQAPARIHDGLTGLRANLGCSLAAVILLPHSNELFYITAGHPGVLTGSAHKFRYLATEGSRPGGANPINLWQSAQTNLHDDEDTIVLYSDGIVPANSANTQWLGRVRSEIRDQKHTFLGKLIKQLLVNSRIYRKNREIEDDLTLLILRKSTK